MLYQLLLELISLVYGAGELGLATLDEALKVAVGADDGWVVRVNVAMAFDNARVRLHLVSCICCSSAATSCWRKFWISCCCALVVVGDSMLLSPSSSYSSPSASMIGATALAIQEPNRNPEPDGVC